MAKIETPAGLEVVEPSARHVGSILIIDAASNDIAEFFHAEHATVAQSYEQALSLARLSVAAPDLLAALTAIIGADTWADDDRPDEAMTGMRVSYGNLRIAMAALAKAVRS